jgi:hypothetical protein
VIPEKIHFVWSGKSFPFAFALAIRSARACHPGWEILLHVGVEPESPWWDEVKGLGTIRREDPEAILAAVPGLGRDLVDLHRRVPDNYPAGRSNLVRLAILLSEGGWYLDCDTLCLRPLSDVAVRGAVVGEEWVWSYDQERVASGYRLGMTPSLAAFCLSWLAAHTGWVGSDGFVERTLRRLWGRLELNNAVLACEPGDSWIRRLLELALEQDPTVRFALGPGLVNLGWDRPGDSVLPVRTTPEFFYQFPPSQTVRYFRGPQSDIPADAALLHWCSSNHRDLVRALTPELVERRADKGPWFRAAKHYVEQSRD